MKIFIAFILLFVGLSQYIYFGPNVLSIIVLFLLSFIIGLLSFNSSLSNSENRSIKDSDNIEQLAQIERNRYFRKPE